jgi:hypothetical protein
MSFKTDPFLQQYSNERKGSFILKNKRSTLVSDEISGKQIWTDSAVWMAGKRQADSLGV